MSDERLRWLYSDGGPMLLLPDKYLEAWHGANDLESAQTDYDRACAIGGYVGTIRVADAQGIVLGDAPMNTAWWPISDDRGILVRAEFADSDADVRELLRNPDHQGYVSDELQIDLPPGGLWLFEAAYAGNELTDNAQRIALQEGRYTIASKEIETDSVAGVLHLLARISSPAVTKTKRSVKSS